MQLRDGFSILPHLLLSSFIECSKMLHDIFETSTFSQFQREKVTAMCHFYEFFRLLINFSGCFMTFLKRRISTSPQRDDYGSMTHLGVLRSADDFFRMFYDISIARRLQQCATLKEFPECSTTFSKRLFSTFTARRLRHCVSSLDDVFSWYIIVHLIRKYSSQCSYQSISEKF